MGRTYNEATGLGTIDMILKTRQRYNKQEQDHRLMMTILSRIEHVPLTDK